MAYQVSTLFTLPAAPLLNVFRASHGFLSKNAIQFQLLVAILSGVTFTTGNPVKGINDCLNNEDCLGAKRECYRNTTMISGVCVCLPGYKQAVDDKIKCLNIAKEECDTNLDCEGLLPCLPSSEAHKGWTYEFLRSYNKYYHIRSGMKKYCIRSNDMKLPYPLLKKSDFDASISGQIFGGQEPPHTGGGLRPRSGGDYYDHYIRTYARHPAGNSASAGLNPEYINFVEDCMLVLFLLCVLITLMVVHRASCYRQLRRARRDGPLRHIIPHSDDQPPPYSNYGPTTNAATGPRADATTEGEVITGSVVAGGDITDEADGSLSNTGRNPASSLTNHVQSSLMGSRKCTETPPPTYDEALAISQALSASMATNDMYPSLESSNNLSSAHPNFHQGRLFITLPSTNSVDNRMPSTPNTNLVPTCNSTNNNQHSSRSIANRSNICRIIFNRNSQLNATPVVQQQSYHQTQGAPENPSDMASSNSLTDATQDMSSSSPATTDVISRNNVSDSEPSTNANTENAK